ncbi:MAG: PKD domain-containing protein [Flavobacteriales bacterium]|nr:PKD domain-containing protein [Flavobacteriales bacterium]
MLRFFLPLFCSLLISQFVTSQERPTAHENARGGNLKIIPVVVHVIHNYGSENISYEQVESAIEEMNEDFRANNPDINEVASAFTSIVADCEIEFRLAKLDPNGNCTNGVTRTVSPMTYTATDELKDLINWDPTMYLNIWVVDNIVTEGFGVMINFTYLPGDAPSPQYDGILVRNDNFGTIGTASGVVHGLNYALGRYLGLLPLWGTSGSCSDDDGIADTPNTDSPSFICDTTQVTCGTLDNVQNFMNFGGCGRMFTEGQKAAMHTTLNSSLAGRNNLWIPNNLTATGTNDGFTNSCVPYPDFAASRRYLCEGDQVDFTDFSWNADVTSWDWTFEGGMPATSSDPDPTVTYNTAGIYEVSLTVTAAGGDSSLTISQMIEVDVEGNSVNATIVEGIEEQTFPLNSNDDLSWRIPSVPNDSWQRTTNAAATGSASVMVPLGDLPAGSVADLISPPLDFSWIGVDNAEMTFKVAHAPRDGDSDEELRVLVSTNCGQTWSTRYSERGLDLSTNGGVNVSGDFIPTASDWRTETVSLGTLVANSSHALIRFQATSDGQNNLYIDDINIANGALGVNDASSSFTAQVFPNPMTRESMLQIDARQPQEVDMEIFDASGRLIHSEFVSLNAGTNQLQLDAILDVEPGVYFIQIGSESLKLLKSE